MREQPALVRGGVDGDDPVAMVRSHRQAQPGGHGRPSAAAAEPADQYTPAPGPRTLVDQAVGAHRRRARRRGGRGLRDGSSCPRRDDRTRRSDRRRGNPPDRHVRRGWGKRGRCGDRLRPRAGGGGRLGGPPGGAGGRIGRGAVTEPGDVITSSRIASRGGTAGRGEQTGPGRVRGVALGRLALGRLGLRRLDLRRLDLRRLGWHEGRARAGDVETAHLAPVQGRGLRGRGRGRGRVGHARRRWAFLRHLPGRGGVGGRGQRRKLRPDGGPQPGRGGPQGGRRPGRTRLRRGRTAGRPADTNRQGPAGRPAMPV